MADVHTEKVRSYNMSRIRGKNTSPELIVRKFLFSNGFRFRIHLKKLPGSPDIVLKKYNTVINIHGCYFHRHKGCKYCTTPSKTSKTDWARKFNSTIERDKLNNKLLKQLGWNVITIWECQVKSNKKVHTLNSLKARLLKQIK